MRGNGSPPPAVGARGYHPEKFVKTQMINPAFYILVASVLISGLPRTCISKQTTGMSKSLGTNTLLVPRHKKLGYQSPQVPMVVAPMVLRGCTDRDQMEMGEPRNNQLTRFTWKDDH